MFFVASDLDVKSVEIIVDSIGFKHLENCCIVWATYLARLLGTDTLSENTPMTEVICSPPTKQIGYPYGTVIDGFAWAKKSYEGYMNNPHSHPALGKGVGPCHLRLDLSDLSSFQGNTMTNKGKWLPMPMFINRINGGDIRVVSEKE